MKTLIVLLALFGGLHANAKVLPEAKIVKMARRLTATTPEVPWDLVVAIAYTESRYNTKAVGSSHGEQGLMQLRPQFWPDAEDLFNAEENMELAISYLASIRRLCSKHGPSWYVCYNVGPYRVIASPFSELSYYKKVEKQRAKIRAKYTRQFHKNGN